MMIELQVRVVYGTERIYPMNEAAANVAKLVARKTLNRDDLAILKALGFQIKWVPITVA